MKGQLTLKGPRSLSKTPLLPTQLFATVDPGQGKWKTEGGGLQVWAALGVADFRCRPIS